MLTGGGGKRCGDPSALHEEQHLPRLTPQRAQGVPIVAAEDVGRLGVGQRSGERGDELRKGRGDSRCHLPEAR